ncbi:TPA: molecular chaperone [Proteus mirabilis]|nr:molecular chaperone [Proteus mirabilis]
MNKFITKIATILLMSMSTFNAYTQGVSLNKTRVIFTENSKSEIVNITNDDNRPYLIQAGVTEEINGISSPHFMITPPIFRLENKSTSSLRILLKDTQSLPNDKESIFYLNAKVIPSTQKGENELSISKLVLVTNFVIKVIYRPNNIARPTYDDYKKILLTIKDKKYFFDNPTPYYLTVTSIKFNNKKYPKTILLAPYSQALIDKIPIRKASWHIINDYGELSEEFKYQGTTK